MSARGVGRPDSLPHLLEVRARQDPERTAVRVLGAGSLEFGRWLAGAREVAAGLADRGARPGDRIALRFDSREWDVYALCFLGVLAAGCVAVPVSERAAPAELAYMLEHCEPVGVLCGSRLAAPAGPWWVQNGPFDGLQTPIPLTASTPPDPERPAQILYTSGTTGRPKAVLADHANLVHGCVLEPRLRPLRHSEQFLHAFPIGTNAGQTMLVNALNAHAAALVAPRFRARSFARAIEGHQVGSVFLVPAMAAELVDSDASAGADLTGVHLVGSTAAPLPPALAAGLAKVFPTATIVNTYTSTEAAPAFTSMVVDPARPAALGRPVDGAVRILDEAGAVCEPGATGEVWLRSPVSPRSYYRADESGGDERSGAVFRGRWIRMGDLGYFDEDGFLFLVDRDGDVIKTGAFKVSTLQVENALHEHPGVADAAVFGLGHPVLGMVPAAAVILNAPETTAEELRAFLAPRVASHAVPQRFLFLPELPRNPAGKVLKRLLREQAEQPAAARADRPDARVQELQ